MIAVTLIVESFVSRNNADTYVLTIFISGVHRRVYPGLVSIRQPGVIKSLEIGRKRFLFTADTGAVKSYTSAQHGFTWTDAVTAGSLGNVLRIQVFIPPVYANLLQFL